MNEKYPVFTTETECQDCYKCLRSCPVKAIKIEKARAAVMADMCIACGRCVAVCPAGAKKIRRDLSKVKRLLNEGRKVYVSLAPSYAGVMRGWTDQKLIAALKKLGVTGVSETALGAQLVSRQVSREMAENKTRKLYLSTACPAAVDYIVKYRPELKKWLTEWLSPMIAHARLLHRTYGDEAAVVFIGPCVAKKKEADEFYHDVDAAITFDELKDWLEESGLSPQSVAEHADAVFVPETSHEGAIYPVAGGMIETLKALGQGKGGGMVTVSGMDYMQQAFAVLDADKLTHPVFMELLACEGGCVNGPGCGAGNEVLLNELEIRSRVDVGNLAEPAVAVPDISRKIEGMTARTSKYTVSEIESALHAVGKYEPLDELNCGGCGYDTCRAFAEGLLDGRAEPSMCLSFLRRQVQKKANALLRCMPSGVVIADAQLHVVECNRNFAMLFGDETLMSYDIRPGLEGASLDKIVPFVDVFHDVLRNETEYRNDMMRVGSKLLRVTVFSIDPHQIVGCIILDVTRTELRREQIAQRAREVINKNLVTVQEVACKLGEHMADTEILLRSIAEDYAGDEEFKHRQKLIGMDE